MALVNYMHRHLVERRKWITDEDYKEGLALAQLVPGPLAARSCIYIGYVHYRILGATLVGIAFIIPSLLMVVGVGMAHVRFGGLPWMQAVFYGVGAAVIGLIAISSWKLTQKSVGKLEVQAIRQNWLLWLLFVALAITIILQREVMWVFVAAGLYMGIKAPRSPSGSPQQYYAPEWIRDPEASMNDTVMPSKGASPKRCTTPAVRAVITCPPAIAGSTSASTRTEAAKGDLSTRSNAKGIFQACSLR